MLTPSQARTSGDLNSAAEESIDATRRNSKT
eukprot:CAMPEP_0183519716 /NCGR_PEP_ID=MMETSP0371-20130417/16335_1 /TAXON_ID=268820 /ORGANISM="Peridinium aciculiferum, Strain PAER-2" /LENGTH=30 /DNA_ID= /DNA_START= /DNA_END= /DNA_ORIENTATION=